MSVELRRISLRNATEIKVKNLLNLLWCIALAQCCAEFLSRWKNVPCPRFALRDTRTHCLLNENLFVAVNVDYLFIDCYGANPDRRIFRCLQQTEDVNLVMRNCYSRNFSLNEFLSGLVIRNLQIAFTAIEPNYQALHFEKLPFVTNVSLSGIRTAGTFDLTFDFQPVIYSLQIFEYNFTSFYQPPFKNLTNLPILKIVNGNLQHVQVELLQELRNLRILALYNNRIKAIPRGFFKGLTLLTFLDLSDNQIENFSEDLFSDLFSLEVLRIHNNELTVLPQNLLSSLSQLTFLQMNGNTGIRNLPKGFLKGLTRLEAFWAFRCSLEHLEESLFSDTTSLIDLFLDYNNITRLPETLFNNTEYLSRLFMTGNKISTLPPPRVFSNLKRLGSLDLSYNRLNHLHEDIFEHLSTLAVLRLSDNDLSSLHDDTLLPLSNLRIIDLSNNNFERLPAKYPFGSSNYLRSVNISNSNLKTFPNIDWSNNNLTEVDLSRNQLREVTLPVFTKKHTKILLDHNNISTVYIDYRRHSNSYPVYNVTGNVIECDCRIRQFLRFLHSDENAVRIFPDSSILRCNGRSERKLTEIWPIYSVCPQKEKCPSLCDCYLTLEDQIAIDCSHRNLSNSPANLPTNATFVFLNDNHIANLSEVDGVTWQNVTHLYLSNNSLTSLNDWVVPGNLSYLALDGNKLSDLPPSLMVHVEDSSNFSIFLSRNEWKCDCHSVLFKKWFTRNLLKIRDSENVTCRRVNRVNNSVTHELIQSTPPDVFCLKEPVWPLWQVIVLTVSVVLLLTSSVLVVVCYHYRLAILAFLYSRGVYLPCWYRIIDDEEKKYDAFVCYSSVDSELTMEMVDRLEPAYRLCIHERDWLAGNPISENIVYSVRNSRRTLVLLSRQFLDSMWFSVEFRVAYNRMMEDQAYRLVLVLVEELENSNELEDDLRRLLSTKTYLKWGEKWFWEKLKYILRKQYVDPSNSAASFERPESLTRSSSSLREKSRGPPSTEKSRARFVPRSAKEAWDTIANFYEDKSILKRLQIKRELYSMDFNTCSGMAAYINEIQTLIDQLRKIGCTIDDRERAELLSMRLPEEYDSLVTDLAIAADVKLTSVAVKAKLLQQAARKNECSSTNESKVFSATRNRFDRRGTSIKQKHDDTRIFNGKCFECNKYGHRASQCHSETNPNQKNPMMLCSIINKGVDSHNSDWIIDSGSAHRLSYARELFVKFRPANRVIYVANDSSLRVAGEGDISLRLNVKGVRFNCILKDVWYVPEVTVNLLSVSQLSKRGSTTHFYGNKCVIRKGELMYATAKKINHLYVLDTYKNTVNIASPQSKYWLWHKRMGHPSEATVKHILKEKPNSIDYKTVPNEVCDVCTKGKSQRQPFGRRKNHETKGYSPTMKAYRLCTSDEKQIETVNVFPSDDKKKFNEDEHQRSAGADSKSEDSEDEPEEQEQSREQSHSSVPTASTRLRRNVRPPRRYGNPIVYAVGQVPFSYLQAIKNPNSEDWINATKTELKAIRDQKVWTLCELPSDKRAIKTKWVFTKKELEGKSKFKARLVAKGCARVSGVDFGETYASTARSTTIRMLFALAAMKNLELGQFDFEKAFLNGELRDEIYVTQPEGFSIEGKENWVCRLHKALYGLKQSGRVWQQTLKEKLMQIKLKRSISDDCLYYRAEGTKILLLLVHVDDIIIAYNHNKWVDEIKQGLTESFKLKDLGSPKSFLGIEIRKDSNTGKITLSQEKYIHEILERFFVDKCNAVSTPCDSSLKLEKPQGTAEVVLSYERNGEIDIVGFRDADYASDEDDRKSYSGYCFKLGNNLMVQKIFLAQLLFLCTAVQGWFFVTDRFGFIIQKMNRKVECGSNVTSYINDYDRAIFVVCRGNTFDAEQIRVCTNSTYFFSVVLRECLLPSPDVGTSLGDKSVQHFFLISEDVAPNSRVTIKNLPNLRDITLYPMENVTYTLEELRNVERIDVLRLMTEKFPNGLFNGLPSLKTIYVVSGRIRSFPEDAFRGLNRLKSLYLFDNRLEDLPETLFYGLQSLENLYLSKNLLTVLPPAIFMGMTSLKKLFLNDNRLNTLPSSLFADNFNLISLNTSNNQFDSLPEMLLQNVSKLQSFGACNCNISELPPKIFSSCYVLAEVKICENRIDRLHPDLFVNNPYIKQMDLHKNRLNELPSTVFRNNKRLSMLDLSNNLLTRIPFEVFDDIQNIQGLSLTGNRITNVEEGKFEVLDNLKMLYLDDNPLGSLPAPRPFGRLPQLTYLGLSNTSFAEFPRMDWSAYNISLLRLNDNRLSILRTEDLPPDNRSRILLMDNNITTVAGKITRNMNNVSLFGNPFRCDCDLRNYIEEVQFSEVGRSLFCDSPSDLTNKSFRELIPSYVVCPVVENCPPKCRCYLYKGFSVMVNCSFSNISHAPAILPENTTIVHLEHNSLSSMEITDSWSGVNELYLDHNRLNPSEHWTFPSSLKVLSLRYNSLQDFPEKFLQYVSESSYIRVDIRNNAFWCNCSFKPFKLWLNRNVRKIMEAEEVKCSRLLSENNTVIVSSVLNFPDDAFCLPPSIVTNVALIVFGSMVCLLGILAMVFAFLFLKYKNTILAYVYVHLPSLYCCKISELDIDKTFDAFISYTGSDRDIVMRLLKELEEKPPFFKLCIHERDWVPGYDVICQIEASIRNSKKTILLLSEEFLNSVWCQAEFQAALVQSLEDKMERIIFVLKDNSVCDVVPADMRELLLSRTYLLWGERWFWEKLRYALPRYSTDKPLHHQVHDLICGVGDIFIHDPFCFRGRYVYDEPNMKAEEFVTFLTLLALTHSCEEFWNSWQTYPCRDTAPLSMVLLCFRTKDNSSEFIMDNSNLLYNCKGGAPDVRLLPCLNVTELRVLTLIECHLTDFEMTNFTFDVRISTIHISYTTERLNFERMTLRGVPSFQKLILDGLRTDGLLQLILEDLPSFTLCQITNHNFTSFTRRPFQRLTNLRTLRIMFGILEDLPEDLFYGMVNLQQLLLKDNRIKKIPPLLFRNLWRLVDLDISGNRIGELTEDLFFNLSNLKTLHIRSNKLKVLPENLLRYVPSLYIFDIVGNTEITSLPKALLKGETYLETFNALNCSIVYLDESFFSHSQRLRIVILTKNHLKRIPSGLFNNTKNLRSLMLGINKLTSLSPAVFYHLSRLEVLQLSLNNLQQLPKDIFKRMSSLSKLDLADNNLQYIHQDTFLPLINLKEVSLFYNNITNLPERNPFGTSRYLNVLLLNNSGLKAFPNIDWSNHNLTLVDLSHNKIREVTLPVFTKNRTEILLNGNNISTIYIDYQQRSNNSPVYNVRGNVIECDCRIRQFLHFLHTDQRAVNIFPDSNTVECNGDSEKKLMEIWPIYGVCPRKKECPLFCDCYLTLEEQTVVDCSRRNLSDPPANLPTNATFVYLNDNRIANLSEVDGVTWQNITHLYLSNNSLTSLNDWIIPEYLSFLTLDGNRLSELPSSLMTHVDNLSNFSIFLSRNEWKCDCHSVRFKKWFTRNLLKIRDSENVTCDRSTRSNNSVQKSLISHVPLDLFCIKETRMEKWHIAVIITCLLCSSVLLAFVAISHYRYKTTILAFLYSRKIYCPCWDAVEDGEDRKYDAFICYNSADRDTMLEMMEQLEPTYSLCVHERDWLPGLPISQHIVYSVQNSRKTVILLSRNFLESIWFKVEFRAAYNQMIHDQAHRLMLVVMGDLGDVSELEKDLRHLLTTKTYLKWGEKWFWEKLKYALHYRKK
ncbi:uncharacterized protein [Centruroides vittatus]|uniref:uncharacterized protein n=1 Tax=Centruroides vittatus TaxID=120091 RepID=UPI00350F6F26